MFLDYFGLIEQPFGVTPDPRFLHLGRKHREALASLLYGTENNRGFLALIASPGMGKTSLLFQYLETLRGQARTAFLFQPARDSRDFLRYLLADLGVNWHGKDLPGMHEALNRILAEEMRAHRRLVLVVDEAQNLGEGVLEAIRVLSNFETPWMKLMQIVISGQPQLTEMLAKPSMLQLRQRVSSIIRLEPFDQEETNAYIDHRLWVSGYAGPPLFSVGARLLIGKHSSGIPRTINNLCFHSLGLASAMGKRQVNSAIIGEVLADLALDRAPMANLPLLVAGPEPQAVSSGPSRPKALAARVRFALAAAVVFAVLFLGLVSGAGWKTDAGSFATANHPIPNAAAFPAQTTPVASAPETSSSPATTPPSAADDSAGRSELPGTAAIPVVVEKDVTLRHLCLLYLNRFDQRTLAEIAKLNPAVTNPDQLWAGQRILLPLYMKRASAATDLRGVRP